MCDQSGASVDCVYWGKLASPGVNHCGDNLTGEGEGDDEQVILRLSSIPPGVATLLFVVNIYTSSRVFRDVDNEFCRLCDGRVELCRFDLDYLDDKVDASNNLVMCKLFKSKFGKWEMQSLGYPLKGPRTAVELAKSPLLREY